MTSSSPLSSFGGKIASPSTSKLTKKERGEKQERRKTASSETLKLHLHNALIQTVSHGPQTHIPEMQGSWGNEPFHWYPVATNKMEVQLIKKREIYVWLVNSNVSHMPQEK